MRKRIVRMDLDRKWLACEQQFEQERRIYGRVIGPLVPDFADALPSAARYSRDANHQRPKVLVRHAHAHVRSP